MASSLMKDIFAKYLFGQINRPTDLDLIDQKWIGRKAPTTFDISLQDFLARGAGRVAEAALPNYLNEFFNPNGPSLTLAQIKSYPSSRGADPETFARLDLSPAN